MRRIAGRIGKKDLSLPARSHRRRRWAYSARASCTRVVVLHDLRIGIRGRPGTCCGIRQREPVQRLDRIMRHADHGRAELLEIVHRVGEIVRLDVQPA